MAHPEPQLGEKLQVEVGIAQRLGVGEIRLNFEVDPLEELAIHLEPGAPDEELAAELGAREGPCAILSPVKIELEPTAYIKPHVTIHRPNEGASVVDPCLECRGLFFLGFFLQSIILLPIDLPAL